MANNPWQIAPGLSNVGSYQVSCEPYATSSIGVNNVARRIVFPQVTKWVKIINYDSTGSAKVGFSNLGLLATRVSPPATAYSSSAAGGAQPNPGYRFGHNYFTVISSSVGYENLRGVPGDSGVLEWKLSELWVAGSGDVAVIAGLTNIPAERCSSSFGPSWSGSAGVG
jgi:hypothetical protein